MPQFVPTEELFKGRHFDQEIVVLCVRWYLSFKLSFRDLVAMMNERGVGLAHTTILRWVQHYTPEFEKRWKRYARTIGGSWRMDETYVKVRGEWVYLYRAVDKAGKTVDFYLSEKRDVNAAKAFLRKAMKSQRIPAKITLDAYAASHRAITELKGMGELPKRVRVRTSKYLNNAIEQDHRRVKQRLRPMLGLKKLADRGGGDRWHRAGRENQEKTIQARRPHGNDARNLASCVGCLSRVTSIETTEPTDSGFPLNLHQSRDAAVS
jgi:transposase-like protein